MAQLIRECVMSCDQCIRETRNGCSVTFRPLQNLNEYITAPEGAMQIGLLPELPPFNSYESIVTAMDVFSRYLFAYPTFNKDVIQINKNITNIRTKQAYLPTTLISDKGSAFVS